MDRPERLNAFTGEMARELIDAIERADADDEARAVTRSVHVSADLLPAACALARENAHNAAPIAVTLTRQID